MDEHITVFLADDHPIFRSGLRQLIEQRESLRVIGEAGDGESALRTIIEQKPRIAILDIEMPKLNGFEIIETIKKKHIALDIIFLTMYKEEAMFNRAMDLGARGYLLKENAATDILQCIEAVIQGRYYISPLISDYLMNRNDRAKSLAREHPALADLTLTEKKILKLISENKTSKEIATLLHISDKTVERHRANIALKLDLKGSHSLLKFAIEHKTDL